MTTHSDLFIGGPYDGQWIRQPTECTRVTVMHPVSLSLYSERGFCHEMPHTVYIRQIFKVEGEGITVWVPEGTDPMETLTRLIDGYRPDTKTPPE